MTCANKAFARLAKRWTVDHAQAIRVQSMALDLLAKVRGTVKVVDAQWLIWAARTHEAGMAISHDGFHRHGDYILRNAELAGFSRAEQAHLAQLAC